MKVSSAAVADVVCVVVFAVVGRSSHAETNNLAGVWHTAWPFLAGCLLGLLLSRSWLLPLNLRTGVIVWLSTTLGGLALRLLSGDTAQPAFVVVAAVSLALLLIGWRFVFGLVGRARTRRMQRVSA